MILDLLGNSGKILAHPGNGDAELWRYVGLRVPQLIARFLPFSVLLGTLITLADAQPEQRDHLDEGGRHLGPPDHRAPDPRRPARSRALNFVFNERVVTRANAALGAWEAVDYGPLPPRQRRPQQRLASRMATT